MPIQALRGHGRIHAACQSLGSNCTSVHAARCAPQQMAISTAQYLALGVAVNAGTPRPLEVLAAIHALRLELHRARADHHRRHLVVRVRAVGGDVAVLEVGAALADLVLAREGLIVDDLLGKHGSWRPGDALDGTWREEQGRELRTRA